LTKVGGLVANPVKPKKVKDE